MYFIWNLGETRSNVDSSDKMAQVDIQYIQFNCLEIEIISHP